MSATNQPNQSRLVQSAALSTLNSLVVDNHFECSICLDAFEGPNVIPECLHRFCELVSRRVFNNVALSVLLAELGSPAGEI